MLYLVTAQIQSDIFQDISAYCVNNYNVQKDTLAVMTKRPQISAENFYEYYMALYY